MRAANFSKFPGLNLARKLQKLLSVEGVQSSWEHVRRWAHPVDTRQMRRETETAAWADLRRRYLQPAANGAKLRDSVKWVNSGYWIKTNVERAQDLELNRRPPSRILDLGCGAGYFLYVCQHLGHEGLGLDIDEDPLFGETTDLLGVRRVIGRIEPLEPVPGVDEPFDLITSHCVCFQKLEPAPDGSRREWGVPEWRFFLADVRNRLLKPGGTLLLDFNPRGGGVFYPADVGEFFRAEGARFFRSKVFLAGAKS